MLDERDTTGLFERVILLEAVFEFETEALYVRVAVLVRELVCDALTVLVPVEDTDTEELSESAPVIEGCAEPV